MTDLLTPLHYDYMLRAIWVSALVGGVCGFLSSFITLKGWSLMGDALSHAVVPGVALAHVLKLPFALGAFVAGLLASGAMALIKAKSRIREDASIGIVFTSFFALGLLLISLNPAGVDRKTIMLLTLLSATAVAALQTVGAILVVAMLITPGATAYLLTDRFGIMLWLSAGLGVVTSLLGAYASYFFNGATGGCIVTLQTLLFLLAFLFAPKHGLISARRRARRNLAAPALP